MDFQDEFHTGEFFRYAAECRRLARLSRSGTAGAVERTVPFWKSDAETIMRTLTTAMPRYASVRLRTANAG